MICWELYSYSWSTLRCKHASGYIMIQSYKLNWKIGLCYNEHLAKRYQNTQQIFSLLMIILTKTMPRFIEPQFHKTILTWYFLWFNTMISCRKFLWSNPRLYDYGGATLVGFERRCWINQISLENVWLWLSYWFYFRTWSQTLLD